MLSRASSATSSPVAARPATSKPVNADSREESISRSFERARRSSRRARRCRSSGRARRLRSRRRRCARRRSSRRACAARRCRSSRFAASPSVSIVCDLHVAGDLVEVDAERLVVVGGGVMRLDDAERAAGGVDVDLEEVVEQPDAADARDAVGVAEPVVARGHRDVAAGDVDRALRAGGAVELPLHVVRVDAGRVVVGVEHAGVELGVEDPARRLEPHVGGELAGRARCGARGRRRSSGCGRRAGRPRRSARRRGSSRWSTCRSCPSRRCCRAWRASRRRSRSRRRRCTRGT